MINKKTAVQRNLGRQPISDIMDKAKVTAHDLVSASTEQITHKMVARACKGRRLTTKVQHKVCNALNVVLKKDYSVGDIFNYKNKL